jgi:hypothetical protein
MWSFYSIPFGGLYPVDPILSNKILYPYFFRMTNLDFYLKAILLLCQKLKVKRIAILDGSNISEGRLSDYKKLFEHNGISIIAFYIIPKGDNSNNWNNIFGTLKSIDARYMICLKISNN